MTISLPPSEPKTWVHACKLSDPIPFCARAFKTKMSCKSQTKNENETKDNFLSAVRMNQTFQLAISSKKCRLNCA